MFTNIILIGPYGAGKSTLAKLIAKRLIWHQYSLDDKRYCYLKEMEEYSTDLVNQMNRWKLSSPEWQKYNIYFVERFLAEYADSDENCVLDLGAGHSVYQDAELFNRTKEIFSPYPNIVLILPTEKTKEALELLLNQIRNDEHLKGSNYTNDRINEDNRFFLEHPSNRKLAKFVVYTKDKTPDETCEEICQLVHLPS